ncbi:MAG TPA: DUF6355 family natural product biosynthesis protein [Pilimelia sp.]|nr:DUF6355 family natural product biosynthesis protein [Pilimelia sp.]
MVLGVLATFVAPTQAQAAVCGYYESGLYGYWNNCSGHRKEYVHIDIIQWPDDYRCLPPGVTRLGGYLAIRDAEFVYYCG